MNSRTGDLGSNPPSSWIVPLPHRLPSSWPAFPSSQSSHPVGMSVTTCHIQAGDKGEVFGEMRMNLQNIGLANILFEFFCNLLWKNPNEFLAKSTLLFHFLVLILNCILQPIPHQHGRWWWLPQQLTLTSSLLPAWAWLCTQGCTVIGLKCSDIILLAGPWDILRHMARYGCMSPLDLLSTAKCVCMLMSDSFVTPWTVALQAPLPMEFPRQEY